MTSGMEVESLAIERFVELSLGSIHENIALDDALLRQAEETEGPSCLRLWEQPKPAVVLGASGRLHEELWVEACQQDGIDLARRTSGGGTVLVGPGAMNAAVILPIEAHPSLRNVDTAQKWIMGHFARAMQARGMPVVVQGSGDLTTQDRKISGSAQRRLRRFLLVHATVLYGDQIGSEAIARYIRPPIRQPDYRRSRAHEDFVTSLGVDRETLVECLQEAWFPKGASLPAAPDIPWGMVRELADGTLKDPAWIGRF